VALKIRGISYMVDEVSAETARSDLAVIRSQLHCTAVILIGTEIPRMIAAARYALEIGLDPWLEPHPVNMSHRRMLRNLEETAAAVEELRAEFPGRVALILGCEFSVHLNAGLPGGTEMIRMMMIRWRHHFRRRINRNVNRLLEKALAVARQQFQGPISYASAAWEEVDWSGFDYAGVNLYRTAGNSPLLTSLLQEHVRSAGRPLVITEFGCGAHVGGAQRGPGSFRIVRWFGRHPRLKKGTVRSERVQAAYICDLIDLWNRNDVYGCFVYTFALRDYPHLPDPKHDLDMASFSVVKVDPDDVTKWQPKEAFHDIARLYGGMDEKSRRAAGAARRRS
jgi:hypothetical protein